MKVLIVYVDPGIRHMLQQVLEVEGHTVICTRRGAEVIRAIEESDDSYLLFTDNLHVNPSVREALAILRDKPALRQRVWVVNVAVRSDPAWIADALIDEHLPMPFSVEQLFRLVEAHASDLTR